MSPSSNGTVSHELLRGALLVPLKTSHSKECKGIHEPFQKENGIVPEIEILSFMIEPTSSVVQDWMSQEPQLLPQ